MPSRNVILFAHMIKYGLPFGLFLAAANVMFTAIFRDGVGMAETVGKSVVTVGVCLLWALVLGLIRVNSKND